MKNEKSKTDKLKQHLRIIIYGSDTFLGKVFDYALLVLILLSTSIIMLESVKHLDTKYHTFYSNIEWFITILFTIEYLLRIYILQKPRKYIFSFYGIVDMLSILPMYLSLFVDNTQFLTAIRALRLLRLISIIEIPQFHESSKSLRNALYFSKSKIIVFMYFIVIITVFIGALMYVVEGEEAGFTSIPTSIYWCIVTLTTVGYGDISPITPLGRFLASIVMILGYGIIAVPTGIVSAEYMKLNNTSKTKNDDDLICKNCSNKHIPKDSLFCNKCGTKI